ncbi:MAG TPA: AAA family ATPase [Candidatus Margulisiibacteriota bacterium]|nr:AAA family ATPase [Candidatus Margulisiibacteriota bacterium]
MPLQPRPLAVLSYLAARPAAVVSREELIAKVWAGTYVTKAVLKVAVRAIREALDDDADAPRYIETVGREGYRFIGGEAGGAAPPRAPAAAAEAAMVGREQDLAKLRAGLARAVAGTPTILFVTGEAGVGKTTLLERFIEEVDAAGDICVARGQCLEQYGEGEAYLPILEALGRLARDGGTGELGETLARHAPTWVPQLATLNARPTAPWGSDGAINTMPARMLREMADALEVFTQRRTLVLVLEDLQWSDPSSLDLIGCIARRRAPARLLVIGSLRPVEMTVADHPLRGVRLELQAKGLCEEVALELLSRDDVAAYAEARFGGAPFGGAPFGGAPFGEAPAGAMQRLATRVYERTEGNALFMVNMVNDLVAGGLLTWREGQWHVDGSIDTAMDRIPSGLQELIGRIMCGLALPVRQVLEAASVSGDEFVVAAVAAALQTDARQIEDVCEQLAAHGSLIVDAGVAEWPDGSVSGRYRFRHALYRRVLYEGIAAARRVRLHGAIGQRLEVGFGARAREHASELAMHFTRGRVHVRALHFHELAAAAALDRHAAHEAVAHCSAALAALAHTPENPEQASRERGLVVARATLLMAIRGYAASETEQAFARARALCDSSPAGPALYPVLRGLLSYHHVRAQLGEAHALGEQLLRHAAERQDDGALRVQAHYGHGATLFHMGAFDAARAHLEAALRDYDPAMHRQHVLVYGGYDPGVACSLWLAWTRALQGELREAEAHSRAGLAFAQRHGDAFSLAWACHGVAVCHQWFSDWAASESASVAAVRLAEEHGFPYVLGMATVSRGWALMMQGKTAAGIAMLRDGVAMVDRTGAALVRPSYLAMLAAADVMEGNRESAVARFDDALAEVERTGERFQEATLLIAKSRLLVDGDDQGSSSRAAADAAEACLQHALDVAQAQGARLLELRSAVALARHWRARGRTTEARDVLTAAHAWFANRRPATPEIVAAQELLAELQARTGSHGERLGRQRQARRIGERERLPAYGSSPNSRSWLGRAGG